METYAGARGPAAITHRDRLGGTEGNSILTAAVGAVLRRLADGEATVNELAKPFPVSVQAVSKHLKVLEGAGLITRGRTAQLRPSRIDGAPLKAAADWIGNYQRFWESGFERMEKRLHG